MLNEQAKYQTNTAKNICNIIVILLIIYNCMEERLERNYPILSVVIARIFFFLLFLETLQGFLNILQINKCYFQN